MTEEQKEAVRITMTIAMGKLVEQFGKMPNERETEMIRQCIINAILNGTSASRVRMQ